MTAAEEDRLLPEQKARVRIDAMLVAAGWVVQDYRRVDFSAARGVALREVPTEAGPADEESPAGDQDRTQAEAQNV